MISLDVVVLPEPDSPARTRTSPFFKEKEIPSTALTIFEEEKIPLFVKYLVRFCTERISSNVIIRNSNYIKRSLM